MTRRLKAGWLIWAVAFLALYPTALPDQQREIPDGVLSILQIHRVIGEDYLLRPDVPNAVMVGSSLTAVLPEIALSPVYNLALSGGSVITGLRLVSESGRYPKTLFIEVNVLMRDADEGLLYELLSPTWLQLKTWCVACRTRNQPATVLLSWLSLLRASHVPPQERDRLAMQTVRNEQRFRVLLGNQLAKSNQPPQSRELGHSLESMATLVKNIRQAGTRVVFVWMPMDDDLNASPLYDGVFHAAREKFPEPEYAWLVFNEKGFRTSDGAHLIYPDARRVAEAISRLALQPGPALPMPK